MLTFATCLCLCPPALCLCLSVLTPADPHTPACPSPCPASTCLAMSGQLVHSSYPSKLHVHCALLYSTKGSFNPPRLKPGVFLKANWGDYDVVSQKGTVTAVKHASVFLKRIQALKDQQWIDIYATALENHEMDDEVGSGGDGVRLGTSSEDELLDSLYDDIPA
ncbi:hypothetical protein BJV74DRAFT_799313 [Russula compacta]|nr:hypothetical protein BJV74DRAFT_799313 [Russula compacta]